MSHSSDIFTFTWKIENFSMLPQEVDDSFDSAVFTVETLNHSKWSLTLYPKGETGAEAFMSCYLNRMDLGKTPIQLGFSFQLESTDVSFTILKIIDSYNFIGYQGYGHDDLVCLSHLHEKKHLFLPQDTLTITCCMWPIDNMPVALPSNYESTVVPNSFNKHCSSVTRIKVEKNSLTWPISNISTLIGSHGKTAINFKSSMDAMPCLELTFSINNNSNKIVQELNEVHFQDKEDIQITSCDDVKNSCDDCVEIEICPMPVNDEHCFMRCKITVLTIDKQYQDSKEATHLFVTNLDEVWRFPSFLQVKNLVDSKYIHIDDTLLLQCDFAFSRKGTNYNVEAPQYVPFNFLNKKASKTNELNGGIRCLYESERLCDVSVRAGMKTFPAHKMVLCARSAVFCAMFEVDMKEKNSSVVDIPDVDPDILKKFLKFLYTDSMDEDMTLEDTCQLYRAADMYQVTLLKQQCSILLLSTLSVASVCDILLLADTHNDNFLMSVVLNFLRSNSTQAFHSAKWKSFKEDYPQLFGDIMIKILMEE